jgi:hypothetical protein
VFFTEPALQRHALATQVALSPHCKFDVHSTHRAAPSQTLPPPQSAPFESGRCWHVLSDERQNGS